MPALQVRLTEDEHLRCREMAKADGLSVSEWVRRRLLDGEVAIPKVEMATYPFTGRPMVIAAPAREVPLPPSRRARVAEPAAPSFEATSKAWIDHCRREWAPPDDAALNALPPAESLAGESIAKLEAYATQDDKVAAAYLGIFPSMVEDAKELLAANQPIEGVTVARDAAAEAETVRVGDPVDTVWLASIVNIAHLSSPPASLLPTDAEFEAMEKARAAKPRFERDASCTSPKCERLQSPTCDACKRANAGGVVAAPGPASPKTWATGRRSPKCITAKCEHLGAPACDPCRRFNARGFAEIEF